MTPQLLERVLKDLPRYGTLIKDYPYRKVWRGQEAEGEAFYLKFYPGKANHWRISFAEARPCGSFCACSGCRKRKCRPLEHKVC